ncbi:hypothetical protein GGE24_000101 [Bradyrhizobium centrosematis]|nr:hypothetical protein [Bradyrhizobium centrosematis]MCS3770789.1 hypothetical protein [Bradyrhizobium centrosematis]
MGLDLSTVSVLSLSDTLVRDLTAHRTLGLRLNLGEQPDVAIVVVTHALAAQIFYVGPNAQVVGIQLVKTDLATQAVGIEDTPAGKTWSDRHANWARQMPRDVAKLWDFVVELDHDSRMALARRLPSSYWRQPTGYRTCCARSRRRIRPMCQTRRKAMSSVRKQRTKR